MSSWACNVFFSISLTRVFQVTVGFKSTSKNCSVVLRTTGRRLLFAGLLLKLVLCLQRRMPTYLKTSVKGVLNNIKRSEDREMGLICYNISSTFFSAPKLRTLLPYKSSLIHERSELAISMTKLSMRSVRWISDAMGGCMS